MDDDSRKHESLRRIAPFGLTALGCHPGRDQQVPRVLPRRVEDPFLWLLHQHRLLPAARRTAEARR